MKAAFIKCHIPPEEIRTPIAMFGTKISIFSLLSVMTQVVNSAAVDVPPAPAAAPTPDEGGFFGSCRNTSLQGSILVSTCHNNFMTYVSASINLDNCLQSGGGLLEGGSTGYAESCPSCTYTENTGIPLLTCQCLNGVNTNTTSDINLNNVVANRDGVLACDMGG